MPTDLDFANDLNLDATDTVQIVNRLKACVHFMSKIEARVSRIDQILVRGGPPIHPDIKTQLLTFSPLVESVRAATIRLNELPVATGGLGDGGE